MQEPGSSFFGSAARQQALGGEAAAYVGQATAMIGRARMLVTGDRIAAAGLLHARCDALAALLGRYQRFKHGAIFDPVVAHGTASSRIVARLMKAECIVMGDTFGGYHARWTGVDVALRWPAYKGETLEMVDRLLTHIAVERDAMGKLLDISGLYARGGAAAGVATSR